MGNWISVEERCPAAPGFVLGWYDSDFPRWHGVHVGLWDGHEWPVIAARQERVAPVYWMPLPDPPKMPEDQGGLLFDRVREIVYEVMIELAHSLVERKDDEERD